MRTRVVVFVSGFMLAGAPSFAQGQRAAVPPATACNSEYEICRDDCTMDFGASLRTRAKLGQCLVACQSKHRDCIERWTEMHRNNLEPVAPAPKSPQAPPAPAKDSVPASAPTRVPEDTHASAASASESNELTVEPEKKPCDDGVKMPTDEQLRGAGSKATDADPPASTVHAEEKPQPPPEPKRSAQLPKKEEPPPPKKPDISEWDPDGD